MYEDRSIGTEVRLDVTDPDSEEDRVPVVIGCDCVTFFRCNLCKEVAILDVGKIDSASCVELFAYGCTIEGALERGTVQFSDVRFSGQGCDQCFAIVFDRREWRPGPVPLEHCEFRLVPRTVFFVPEGAGEFDDLFGAGGQQSLEVQFGAGDQVLVSGREGAQMRLQTGAGDTYRCLDFEEALVPEPVSCGVYQPGASLQCREFPGQFLIG